MIPESLRLRNFMSHRETDIDLRGVHLASLVGVNGAGKSALLDAMTWAVWGRSRAPYGHDDDLVYHGESSLEVEFVFRMPYQTGAEHRCRILRRRQERGRRAVSSLLDFEIETEEGWRILTSDSIRETQQLIIDHLGLDYDTFINSAYLRQGHADEFTVQSPAQRKHVLSTLLGLDRWSVYQDRAKVKLSAVHGQMRELDRRLDETEADLARRPEFESALNEAVLEASASEAELAGAQTAMDEVTRLREQSMALRRQVEDLARRRSEAVSELSRLRDDIEGHRGRLAYYQALVKQGDAIQDRYEAYQEALAGERGFGQKLSQAARLQEDRAHWDAEIAEARASLTHEMQALELDETRLDRAIADGRSQLDAALGGLKTQDSLLAERFAGERLMADLRAAEEAVFDLAAVAREQELVRASLQETEVDQSRRTERNRQLRDQMAETKSRLDSLAEAEATCPLCGQPLSVEHRTRMLVDIEAQGRSMGDEFRANRQGLAELAELHSGLAGEVRDLDVRLRARAGQEQRLARLQQQVEQGEAARQRSRALQAEISALEGQLSAEDYAGPERQTLARVLVEKSRIQGQLTSQDFATEAREALSGIVERLSDLGYDAAAHDRVKASVLNLQGAEDDFRELEKARVAVESESQAVASLDAQIGLQLERTAQLEEQQLRQEAVQAELEPALAEAPAVAQRLMSVRQLVAAARQRVGAAKQNLAALDTLAQRIVGMREEHIHLAGHIAIYTELRDAFGVNGIPAMIIEHTMPELERDANRILQQLTGGRMHVRFDTQRETKAGDLRETLDIIISDEKGTRPYESFSGGEQFRINFAIRVALSRMLAQRAGVRLRSLFVDEGFGALDADGRQRLVEAVKAVEGEFDMILVITHIDELREAFPTQIQVTKTDSGSQVEIL